MTQGPNDPKKPKAPTVRPGSGENKDWNNGSGKAAQDQSADGKKYYRKNTDTGKTEEYSGKLYQDDKSKPMKSNPHSPAIKAIKESNPSFKNSENRL